jgi:hypothetical protein
MGLFNDIDPIFFYHKSVKPLLAMGFNGVVTRQVIYTSGSNGQPKPVA